MFYGVVNYIRVKIVESTQFRGEMSEWLKEHAWKACVGETLPGVRISFSPPLNLCRARWGVSGALYLQSATAGSNSTVRL